MSSFHGESKDRTSIASNVQPQHGTLSLEHYEYLMKQHGTVDLDPLPSTDPKDPYNWPSLKKHVNLIMVSFHAMVTLLQVAAPIPAYEPLAVDLGTTIQGASYLTSSQILILGVAPLIWRPFSSRYGRRPTELISTFGSGAFNIGCALSPNYGAMIAFRCLSAFFIAPPIAIGPEVVVEMFQASQRGQKTGIWTLMLTLGPPMGPFIFGFVAQHVGWPWIYWVLAILNFTQCIAYLLLGSETRYDRSGSTQSGRTFLKRFPYPPLSVQEVLEPITIGKHMTVLIPALAYAIILSYAGIMIEIEIPQTFVPKFGLDPQQLGLNYLATLVGTVLGELAGGWVSDAFVRQRAKRLGHRPVPEYRLWVSYPGFVIAIVGIIVFGVQLQNAQQGQWNITPMIGTAIAAGGYQIVTTILYTYSVDCNADHGGSVGGFFAFTRQTWGFIGPFYYPQMFESLGYVKSFCMCAGLVAACSALPVIILHFLRSRTAASRSVGLEAGLS